MTRTDDAHKLPGHIVEAELLQCPRCGCSVLSLDVVHYCVGTGFHRVIRALGERA